MISMLITLLVASIVIGIFLRSALHAALLIGVVLGVFFLSCYACAVSPRAILSRGTHVGLHAWKRHRHVIREWL